jgi:hypothetical protein
VIDEQPGAGALGLEPERDGGVQAVRVLGRGPPGELEYLALVEAEDFGVAGAAEAGRGNRVGVEGGAAVELSGWTAA